MALTVPLKLTLNSSLTQALKRKKTWADSLGRAAAADISGDVDVGDADVEAGFLLHRQV